MKPTTKTIKLTIILIFLLFLSTLSARAATNDYYSLKLHYENGDITLQTMSITPFTESPQINPGYYLAEIVSENDEIINLTYFDIPTTIYYDSFNPETGEIIGGGTKELTLLDIDLILPYYDTAKEINIYDKDLHHLLQIPLKQTSPLTASTSTPAPISELIPTVSESKKVFWPFLVTVLIVIFLITSFLIYVRKKSS